MQPDPARMSGTGSALGASHVVRRMRLDELDALHAVDAHAFGQPAEVDKELRAFYEDLLVPERCLVAEAESPSDGVRGLAGVSASLPFTFTVPGGTVKVAGVTWVSVAPTHRRRGVLRAMMRHLLHEVHEHGVEPVAALWASEPMIYGRFGYGRASHHLDLEIPRTTSLLPVAPDTDGLRLRLVDAADVDLVRHVYDEVARRRPGMPHLDEAHHRRQVFDPESRRHGFTELRCVVVEGSDGVRGFARYAVKDDWSVAGPDGTVRVRALHALDAPAAAALWSYLLDLDLMARVKVHLLPVDDPLLQWLPDTRRAQPRLGDALYVRLVDLPRALAARTFAAPVDAVLEVRDALCPWNDGRWRLVGDARGATCERTEDEPDVTLDVRELGAVYLGGTSLAALADAGLVEEHERGVVAALSHAFRHEPAPYSPFVF